VTVNRHSLSHPGEFLLASKAAIASCRVHGFSRACPNESPGLGSSLDARQPGASAPPDIKEQGLTQRLTARALPTAEWKQHDGCMQSVPNK
jgi:hypothetical protein